ncbi:hypothetical protein V5O48_016028 [Marasmius crinis-equi]|uniref:Cysteine-rich transmembrane CYSTM domain-containing protein n=1 Tax=Marasmius crinis-equi TaxID=585013 RepID=A0ABR3ESX3_9AGAR
MSDLTPPTKAVTTNTQPQAGIEMNVTGAPAKQNSSQKCEHQGHKVSRLRGGGAGKDCFLGLIGCFLCCECCEVSLRPP